MVFAEQPGHGSDDRGRPPIGWLEAVTRLRLPQNPACGSLALGSSEVDSQFGGGSRIRVREVELRFKQRELRLDPSEFIPRDRAVRTPTAQYFARIAFHGPRDLYSRDRRFPQYRNTIVTAKDLIELIHLLWQRRVPH
jgi:hypothetical protein